MCVLRVTSENFSFSEFLKKSTLPTYDSYEKGDLVGAKKQRKLESYGFACAVSDREWTDLKGQIEDAAIFLKQYEKEIQKLFIECRVDDIRLDFPYSCRLDENLFVQCDYLPPAFIKLAGNLGIGIELSHYHPSLEDEDSEPVITH